MTPLRLAVIGAGHLGRFHALIASRLEEIDLVAVVDPNEAARERVASEAGAAAVADYRQIADQVEAAVVATPTHTHHAIACDLLEHDVSLLVEKPLAITEPQASDLVERAKARGVALQVGHVERFNPAFRCVASEIGDPKFIEATRLSGYSFRSNDIGVVLDMMIHDLDLVLTLARSPLEKVQALGISVLGGHEDMATARLTFASGCVAHLTASRVSFEPRRSMQVFTGRGFAAIDFAEGKTECVTPREDVLRRELAFHQLSPEEVVYWKQHMFDELLVRTTHEPARENAIELEQRNLVAHLRSGEPLMVDGAAGRDAIAVAEQILAAINDHNWDGRTSGRSGPLAMPALPILPGPTEWHSVPAEHRRAG